VTLSKRSSLREQLRRARAKGVRVRRVAVSALVADASLKSAIERLLDRFVASRRLAPMGFVVQLDPFRHAARKIAFVAERDGELLGYLGVVPIPGRNGWFLEDLVRDRHAPNGTGELMIDAAMRAAVDDGIAHATLGLAPLSGPIPEALARIRDMTRFLYDFRGLRRFKEKLGPVAFEPVYITYPPWHSAFAATLASLHAFANGSFVRFGLRSLHRQPRLLAALVVIALVSCAAVVALFAS
jgi:phosphatidylglycerol lysyltransferase